MPRSPWRRIRLASIAAGLMADRSGWIKFTTGSLAPATGVGTTRFCRTQQAPFVLRAVVHSRETRPANTLHADAVASTASHPASVTTRDPPLVRDETAELIVLIWGGREGNCFCARDWTGQITSNWLGKLAFWRNVRGSDRDSRFATSCPGSGHRH
jgi:hypothetical protein